MVLPPAIVGLLVCALSTKVPNLHELAGDWISVDQPLSEHIAAQVVDLPIVSNFHGSLGTGPGGRTGGVRPVDLFAINSVEVPPFGACT